ncbi:MAG: VCBS repeat-containing protein [Ferruginibacter sp.]
MKAKTNVKCLICIIFVTFLISCSSDTKVNSNYVLFQQLSATETGIDFTNTVVDTKDFNVFKYRNFYNGGGVAIGDVNNDGLPDIFFTSNQQQNKLYLNKGNWKFEDVTEKANVQGIHKWHTGVTMVDINGDGWLDIYVCNSGDLNGDDKANDLFINQKDGTFKEEAYAYGLDDKGLSTHAAFFDYDHDGDLDCYVLNNSYRPVESFGYNRNLRNVRSESGGDRLYRNDNGKFVDMSAEAGIYGSEIGFGLGISVGDVNNDGWDDIYVSNDFFERDYLYINQQNGTFKETISDAMGHISQASMGSDMADINNDGNLDIFTTDMLPDADARLKNTTKFDEYDVYNAKLQNDFHHQFTSNCLQLNNGDGTYSEIAQYAGVAATDWSWGALSFDFNNDGYKDLFVSNGISHDLTNQDFVEYFASDEVMKMARAGTYNFKEILDKMPATPIANCGFINQQNLQFKNETEALGFSKPSFSNGAAYGDLDGDGDLDLVVNNENMEAFVYRNTTSEKKQSHYLKIKLAGANLNTFGIGAKVTLYTQEKKQLLQMMPSRGFESSVEPVLNFGLGKINLVDSLLITWPNMKIQLLKNIPADTTLTLQQTAATIDVPKKTLSLNSFYTNATNTIITGEIRHHENNFIDFNVERLVPKMLSTEGPKLAVGDVNGDGLEDFFVGGAVNDAGKIFVQKTGGNFIQLPQFAFETDKENEDAGAIFFDADNDGDSDLVIISGGNQFLTSSPNSFVRLYLNNGKGIFIRSFKSWPIVSMNGACVVVDDIDGDGDEDIFIGARNVVGAYGIIPSSKLLINDGKGNFTDATKLIAPDLLSLGMVTDAKAVDVDGDGKKEIVVVGDWMPVTVLKYQDGKLKKENELSHSSGWWNCITIADLDGDGDMDLIAGNTGLNSKIKADKAHPAFLYSNDFDKNGQLECIQVYYKSDGKAYPFNLRADIVAQMPLLKKKFLTYTSYAGKQVDKVFSKEDLDKSVKLSVEQTQSCIFRNNGKGQFTMEPLPVMAQLSQVFSILCTDLNKDGITDLFLSGNFYGLKPEVGRYDASYGVSFLGTAKHTFKYISSAESGLLVKGEVRDAKEIITPKGKYIVVARNNDLLQIFLKR